MRIIGIDPGSRVTGFGVIQVVNRAPVYIASGCIRVQAETSALRLKEIQEGLQEILKQHCPTMAAIEQIFMFENPGAALKLGQARGVALCTLATYHLPIYEYSARQVKQSVVGIGHAEKMQVQNMVQRLLTLSKKPQADAADALAVALCHLHTHTGLYAIPTAQKLVRRRLR